MNERYAIYLAPESDTEVWRFGTSWLGRDPETGRTETETLGLPAALHAAITATPARYGFHATLKPPFRLAAGFTVDALHDALDRFTEQRAAFDAPPVVLSELHGFLALVPDGDSPALEELAAACVRGFDEFRAPPSEAEIAHRNPAALTPGQRENLTNWGYPYVMRDFRCHMTLTGRLSETDMTTVRPVLEAATQRLCAEPLTVRSVALYHEPSPGADFHMVRRFPFHR
jgi:putative phosphonate metabolism protein